MYLYVKYDTIKNIKGIKLNKIHKSLLFKFFLNKKNGKINDKTIVTGKAKSTQKLCETAYIQ